MLICLYVFYTLLVCTGDYRLQSIIASKYASKKWMWVFFPFPLEIVLTSVSTVLHSV